MIDFERWMLDDGCLILNIGYFGRFLSFRYRRVVKHTMSKQKPISSKKWAGQFTQSVTSFVKIFGLKYIPKMEVYIILAKTVGTDLYKKERHYLCWSVFFDIYL